MAWWKRGALALACVGVLGSSAPADAAEFRLLELGGRNLKWGVPEFGKSTEIRFRVVTTPRDFPLGFNCPRIESPDSLLVRNRIPTARFAAALRAAFDLWEQAAGVRFQPAADERNVDLLIGAQAEPRGIAFTGLRYWTGSEGALSRLTAAAICLNPELAWEATPDGSLETYDLRRVLVHEIGHVLGLDHPGPEGQIMAFSYREDGAALGTGDIAGAVRLYGPPDPPDDAATGPIRP